MLVSFRQPALYLTLLGCARLFLLDAFHSPTFDLVAHAVDHDVFLHGLILYSQLLTTTLGPASSNIVNRSHDPGTAAISDEAERSIILQGERCLSEVHECEDGSHAATHSTLGFLPVLGDLPVQILTIFVDHLPQVSKHIKRTLIPATPLP